MHAATRIRRATAWAMLALYGLVASGLPLPISMPPAGTAAAKALAGKDRSQPFPCMDRACGCDSAERCFTNCCCHTPAETLAWAKARGIEPAVIAALSRRVAAAAPTTPSGGCCSADADDEADDAMCSDYQSLAADPKPLQAGVACQSQPVAPATDDAHVSGVVILRDMLACGGIASGWSSIGMALPPPAIVTCELPWPQVGVLPLTDASALGTGGPPDLPPPRG